MTNKDIQDYTLEKDFDKKFTNFLENDLGKINHVEDLLKQGLVASYTDKKGRIIRHYPNGRKFIIEYNKDTDKVEEKEEIIE